MSERTEKVLVCDQCGVEASDKGKTWIGGHPHVGWLHVKRLYMPCNRKFGIGHEELDFCTEECLVAWMTATDR